MNEARGVHDRFDGCTVSEVAEYRFCRLRGSAAVAGALAAGGRRRG